jgi:uncharacterized membrane protein YqiK
MEQQRLIATQRAENDALTAAEVARREQETEQAQIAARQQITISQTESDRVIKAQNIELERSLELARQEQSIAIQNKSRDESIAKAEADAARAEAIKAAESITTAQETARAERAKQIAVLDASREAEQKAVSVTVQAKAEKEAAANRAEAKRIEATAEAEAVVARARGQADAAKLKAEADEETNRVAAEGQRALIDAKNTQTPEQMAYDTRLALINAMPSIIREQVKPMEQIDSIRIVDMGNSRGQPGTDTGDAAGGSGNLASQAVDAALKYRLHAPMLQEVVSEAFGGDKALESLLTTSGVSTPTVRAPVAPQPMPIRREQAEEVADFYAGKG